MNINVPNLIGQTRYNVSGGRVISDGNGDYRSGFKDSFNDSAIDNNWTEELNNVANSITETSELSIIQSGGIANVPRLYTTPFNGINNNIDVRVFMQLGNANQFTACKLLFANNPPPINTISGIAMVRDGAALEIWAQDTGGLYQIGIAQDYIWGRVVFSGNTFRTMYSLNTLTNPPTEWTILINRDLNGAFLPSNPVIQLEVDGWTGNEAEGIYNLFEMRY